MAQKTSVGQSIDQTNAAFAAGILHTHVVEVVRVLGLLPALFHGFLERDRPL